MPRKPTFRAMAVLAVIPALLSCSLIDDLLKPSGDETGNDENVVETTLHIQESANLATANGFVSTSGLYKTDKTGYTGLGFISYLGVDSSVVYSIHADAAGSCRLVFRYSFGGTETNIRDAYIVVNGAKVQIDADKYLEFAYTGAWETWNNSATVTVSLIAGDNNIRLQSATGRQRDVVLTAGANAGMTATGTVTGLPNIDRLTAIGVGISAGANTTVFYRLKTAVYTDGLSYAKTSDGTGSVTVAPEQDFYLAGTAITTTALPAAGHEFQSWTGTVPSVQAAYTFAIAKDMKLAARFLPAGTTQPDGLVGFGAYQDDLATPYTLTGGLGGQESTIANLSELQTALAAAGPAIIRVNGLITTPDNKSVSLTVTSHKTLLSAAGVQGHLKNIELKFSGHNYIVRNLVFSEVIAADVVGGAGNDCVQLNGARHVWVDHCEFYSSLGPSPVDVDSNGSIDEYDAKDYYDGLLDIKNGASFITLSNNYFHDHWKAILVGSGDDLSNMATDGQTRLTLRGNYFRDVNSRSPLIRYGKAHVYNNYYFGQNIQIDSTVNARCYAQVKVEGNYFENCDKTVGFFYDTSGYPSGTWNMLDNIFIAVATGVPASTGTWTPAFGYTTIAGSAVKAAVPGAAGVGIIAP